MSIRDKEFCGRRYALSQLTVITVGMRVPDLSEFNQNRRKNLEARAPFDAGSARDHLAVVPRGGSLSLDGVSVFFRRAGEDVTAVRDISLRIAPGEFVALLGPSGCGKSTLLNVLAGFRRPDEGVALLNGKPHYAPTPLCGVVFQKHALFPWMTVLGNVAFGPRRLGLANADALAREMLDMVGLSAVANAWPSTLSGGMQQRVGLARALVTRPPVLLMDEPFGALDAQTRGLMQAELLKIWMHFRTTLVFVTHDIDEAIYLADRVVVMRTLPGTVGAEFQIALDRPRDPAVMESAQFLAYRRAIAGIIREEARKVFGP
jgi:NitT/TauT family transport system ATP-binding protein